jgi:hypothetical protein
VDRNLALQTVLLLEEHEEGLILLDTKCLLNQAEDGLEEGVVVVDALDCLPASRSKQRTSMQHVDTYKVN